MKWLTQILLILSLPLASQSQTVHTDEGRIVYKGAIHVSNASKEELFEKARLVLANRVRAKKTEAVEENKDKTTLVAQGSMRLATPHHLIRRVEYVFEMKIDDDGYKYRIDSVNMKQIERGGEKEKISSDKMLKGVEVTGPESIDAERQLNEIDMNFQKLIALINSDLKGVPVAKNKVDK